MRPIGIVRYLAFARRVDAGVAPPLPLPRNVVVRPAGLDDCARLAAALQHPAYRGQRLTPGEIADRLRQEHLCIIAEHDGEIALFAWARFDVGMLEHANVLVPLAPGEAYLGAVFATANHRGRGVAVAAMVGLHEALRQRGIHTIQAWVRHDNLPVIKSLGRFMVRPVGHLTQIVWRYGRRFPLMSIVEYDAADPLTAWIPRIRHGTRGGPMIFRRRRQSEPVRAVL